MTILSCLCPLNSSIGADDKLTLSKHSSKNTTHIVYQYTCTRIFVILFTSACENAVQRNTVNTTYLKSIHSKIIASIFVHVSCMYVVDSAMTIHDSETSRATKVKTYLSPHCNMAHSTNKFINSRLWCVLLLSHTFLPQILQNMEAYFALFLMLFCIKQLCLFCLL